METQSDQLLNSQKPEKPFRGGFGRSPGSGVRFGDICAFLPIPLFLGLLCVLASDDVERTFESYSLLLVLNTLFLSALPLVVSYFSLRAYLASGHMSLLMLGNGALSLGLGSFLAALTPLSGGGPNTIVTMHNTAALLSGLFNLSGAVWVLGGSQKQASTERRGFHVGVSAAAIVLFFGALFLGVLKGLTPTFFVQGVGPTYLRQVVLGTSIGCFTIAAAVIASVFVISRSRFLSWYWMALALIATGLLCVFVQKSVGSDVGWLGRAAQYLGGGYLLVAVLAASRELRDRNMDFLSHLWTFFFNRLELEVAERTRELVEANERLSLEIAARKNAEATLSESERTFRSMFENSLDGIMFTAPDGAIFKANKGACHILGRSERELCEQGRTSVVDTDDPRLGPALKERSQTGHFRGELNYRRKDGTAFPVELTSAVYSDAQGNLRTSTIFRDVTERKRMEEDLRKARDELEERVAERTAELKTMNEKLSLEITERKRAEEELQTTLNRFYSILSNQYGSLLLVAEDGRIEFANQAFCDQFELEVPPTALKGLTPQDIIQQIQHVYADPAQAIDRIREIIQQEQPIRDEEIAIRGGRTYQRDFVPIWIDGKLYGRLWHHRDISDRKRSEEKLKESEERLSLTLQVSNAGRWEWNVGSDEVSYDERFHTMLGYEMGELPTSMQEWLPYHHQGDMAIWMSKAQAYLVGDSPSYESEHRIRSKDGDWKWVFTRGKLVSSDTPEASQRFIGMAIDVTERKKVEETLRESEQRYRTVADFNYDWEYWIDSEQMFLYISPSCQRITGYSAQEFLDDQGLMEKIIHPDDLPAMLSHFDMARQVAYDQAHSLDFRIRRRDGLTRWIAHACQPVYGHDGQPLGRRASNRDITDRKQVEENLQLERDQAKKYLDVAGVMLVALNAEGNIILINRRGCEILGYVEEEIIDRNWFDVCLPREICEVVRGAFDQLMSGDIAPVEYFENAVLRSDGEQRIISFHNTVLCDSSSRITGILFSGEDVTDRKQTEVELRNSLQELERSNKELQQFAYVASHDLQEPLRMVASYTQLLAQRYGDQLDEKAKKYIGYAVEGAVRMQQLINDLLSFSRVTTRGADFQLIDSQQVLGTAISNLRQAIRESGALITNDELPYVMADRTQLAQIFQNLISNAIKFQDKGPPEIHVSARAQDQRWLFSVKDNGIGIDPRYKHKMFVIFQRLHTRQEYPGTGIGLAICQRIINRHGGDIWFDSKPGEGTTFYFTLPRRKQNGEDNGSHK